LGALALIAALSGCSVATQNTATPLPPRLALAPTTTPTTVPNHGTHQLQVYFLKDGRLYPVLEYYSTDPLGAALLALGIGPSVDEADHHITTAFSASPAEIASVGPVAKNGVALIEVDSEFTTLPGVSLEEAFAQIVFTVTGLPNGPSSVEFLFDQSRMEALIPPGQLVNRPVMRSDYCAFAPLSYLPCQKSTGTTGVT
jgi:spore germination protein GerM